MRGPSSGRSKSSFDYGDCDAKRKKREGLSALEKSVRARADADRQESSVPALSRFFDAAVVRVEKLGKLIAYSRSLDRERGEARAAQGDRRTEGSEWGRVP